MVVPPEPLTQCITLGFVNVENIILTLEGILNGTCFVPLSAITGDAENAIIITYKPNESGSGMNNFQIFVNNDENCTFGTGGITCDICLKFNNSSGSTFNLTYVNDENSYSVTIPTNNPDPHYWQITGMEMIAPEFSNTPCCFDENTLVNTPNGLVPIKQIKAGDYVYTLNDQLVEVINNIKFIPTKKYILIEKNAFENNLPEQDILVTPAHPIYLDSVEIASKQLVNGTTVREVTMDQETNVYSIQTRNRMPFKVSGQMFMTWGEEDWEAANRKRTIIHWMQ